MWWSLVIALFPLSHALNVDNVFVAELFQFRLDPTLFNWTFSTLSEQFTYSPSKVGFPDLPRWLSYMYSKEHHAGFIFGTPPENLVNQVVPIEVIAKDLTTFDTKELLLNLLITPKTPSARIIQMKIDNLNWIQMMDPGRVETLKNVFRVDLWPESSRDLRIVYMNSAVSLGARVPLNPQEKEGVVVHLGSSAPFSARLIELQDEVKPLYKMSSCAFKRTSVQTKFQSSGFRVDWCSFHIVDVEEQAKSEKQSTVNEREEVEDRWFPVRTDELPIRNYSDELAISLAVPGVILTFLVAMLTAILCFHHEDLEDEESEQYFNAIFDFCLETFRNEAKKTPQVQLVQYSPLNNQPVTTLRSLRDITPNHFIDNASLRSHSPGGSFYENSPVPTLRPQPPPYRGKMDIGVAI